jgi:hypothetical protein
VVLRQRLVLFGQGRVLCFGLASPGIELLGPALQFDDVNQPGLVEVHQPSAFGFGGVAAPLEPG